MFSLRFFSSHFLNFFNANVVSSLVTTLSSNPLGYASSASLFVTSYTSFVEHHSVFSSNPTSQVSQLRAHLPQTCHCHVPLLKAYPILLAICSLLSFGLSAFGHFGVRTFRLFPYRNSILSQTFPLQNLTHHDIPCAIFHLP